MRSPTDGSPKDSDRYAALRPKTGHQVRDETGQRRVLPTRSRSVTSEREHPRFAHEAVVTLYAGANTFWGRTQNMSRGGLCADIAEAIAVGTNIEVDIQLVFEDAESE